MLLLASVNAAGEIVHTLHKESAEIFLYILIHINFKPLIRILMFTISNDEYLDANKILLLRLKNQNFINYAVRNRTQSG